MSKEDLVLDTTAFLEERKLLLKGKLVGDNEMVRKLKLSINTHNTLIEVVEENKLRFDQPGDMIDQFVAINERFEAQLKHVETDMRKTEQLIDIITNIDEYTAVDTLLVLLASE